MDSFFEIFGMKRVLNPGSDEAIDAGCTCPVLDNHHGKGIPINGRITFYINEGCPIHDKSSEE